WGIWTSDHPVEVVLRFTPRVAARVLATTWHESQETRQLSDGSVELRLLIAEPTEIRPWILGWGQECEVVGPAELRESIIEELSAALDSYPEPRPQARRSHLALRAVSGRQQRSAAS